MKLSKIVAAAGLAFVALTGATAANAQSYRWEREHRWDRWERQHRWERMHRWERHHGYGWDRHHRGYDRCWLERHYGRLERVCRW